MQIKVELLLFCYTSETDSLQRQEEESDMLKKIKENLKNKKGFTLVELIVVIVIILVLATVMVPQVLKYVDQARMANCKSDAATILSQVQVDLITREVQDELNLEPVALGSGLVNVKEDGSIPGENEASVTLKAGEVVSFAYNDGKYTASWSSSGWSIDKNG